MPPSKTPKPSERTERTPLRDEILAAFEASGLTGCQLAKQADLAPSTVNRFLAGSKDWTLDVLAVVAPILGLRLIQVNQAPKTRRKKSRSGPS